MQIRQYRSDGGQGQKRKPLRARMAFCLGIFLDGSYTCCCLFFIVNQKLCDLYTGYDAISKQNLMKVSESCATTASVNNLPITNTALLANLLSLQLSKH